MLLCCILGDLQFFYGFTKPMDLGRQDLEFHYSAVIRREVREVRSWKDISFMVIWMDLSLRRNQMYGSASIHPSRW
uniref:Uncharacterized protein n=1 Tax=Lepeophtheirus salmonis TaxID=72036 RepID=A0A0K2URZ8_LEPSM